MKITVLLLGAMLIGAISQATCRKHLNWSQEECANVEKKKLFVGMTREMIDAEKPHSCVLDKHAAHREPDMIQFVCYVQYLHAILEDQRREVASVEALLFGPKRTQICSAS